MGVTPGRLFLIAWVVTLVAVSPKGSAGDQAREAGTIQRKVAVLDLRDQGVGPRVASLLTGVVASRLARYGLFSIISRDDIRNMLEHEQSKQLLGCSDSSCLAEIGGALGVDTLVTGEAGLVGDNYLLSLQRINIREGKVENRVQRQFKGSQSQLLSEMEMATHRLVEDILKAESGKVLLSISEEGADISVDGKVVGVSPLQGLELPAGPHEVRIEKRGFVNWARTIQVRPREADVQQITLIPSSDYILQYQDQTERMRRWTWITGAAFVALELAAVGLRLYTWREYDPIVDDYNARNYESLGCADEDACYQKYRDDIDLADTLDYTALGMGLTGLALGAISLYLFVEGEDPHHYDQFRGLSARTWMPAPGFFTVAGGGVLTGNWGF